MGSSASFSCSLSASLAGDAASLSLRGEAERLLDLLFERLRERLADLCATLLSHSLCSSTHGTLRCSTKRHML